MLHRFFVYFTLFFRGFFTENTCFRGYFPKNPFFRVFDVISPRVILPEPTQKRGALIQVSGILPV